MLFGRVVVRRAQRGRAAVPGEGVDVGERLDGGRQFNRAEARERVAQHLPHLRVPRVMAHDMRRHLAPAVHGAAQGDAAKRRAEPRERRRHVGGAKRERLTFSRFLGGSGDGRRSVGGRGRRVRDAGRHVVRHDAVLDERQDALVVAALHQQVVQRALLPRGSVERPRATARVPLVPPRSRGVRRRRGVVRPREGYRPRASQQRAQRVSSRRHRRCERTSAAPRGVCGPR